MPRKVSSTRSRRRTKKDKMLGKRAKFGKFKLNRSIVSGKFRPIEDEVTFDSSVRKNRSPGHGKRCKAPNKKHRR